MIGRLIRKREIDILGKLVRLAGGNTDLVDQAIRSVREPDKPADLQKIIDFILTQRTRAERTREHTIQEPTI
jgi:hypothetical protein